MQIRAGMVEFIVAVALAGLFVWAITTLIPMPAPFRKVILVVAVVALVLYALDYFGLVGDDWWHYHAHRWR
jgi:hypothetical protein